MSGLACGEGSGMSNSNFLGSNTGRSSLSGFDRTGLLTVYVAGCKKSFGGSGALSPGASSSLSHSVEAVFKKPSERLVRAFEVSDEL